MKKIVILFTIFIFITIQLFANSIQNQAARGQKFASDRILIKFTENVIDQVSIRNEKRINVDAIDQLNEQYHVESVEKAYIEVNNKQMDEQLGISRWYIFKYENPVNIEFLISQLKELPEVEEAIPDFIAYPAAVPNDPMYSNQWGHNNTSQMLSWSWSTYEHTGPAVGTVSFDTNAETGWNGSQGYGSSSVIIAIIDSGVDASHADINQVAGYDYGDNDSNADDNSASPGHGTACAGVAAGIANNNLGVAGIAGGCSIMPLKVADSAGSMYFSAIDNAIYFAANNGADIASLSLGASLDPSSVPSTETALQYALNAGVTIFAATANANNSSIDYPSNSQYVISVGAAAPDDGRKRSSSNPAHVNTGNYTDPNGVTIDNEVWWGSNYGSTTQDARDAVDVIAPTILPTTDISGSGGYSSTDYSMWFNGTSCATPYAAGVAALIKSQNPTWTPAQIRAKLTSTAIDIVNVESATGWDRYSGYGMVDAGAALYDPADITVSPSSFSKTLITDTNSVVTLIIGNTGGSTLNYTASSSVSWVHFSNSPSYTNSIAVSGSNQNVLITIDALGLSANTYNTNIVITSNDPDESPYNVPVTLMVPDNTGSGSGNNTGNPANPAVVDVEEVDIDGSSVNPDVSIDPDGNVGITVNIIVTDEVQGSTPVQNPDDVIISYAADIIGTISGVNLVFDLEFTGLTGLDQIHWLNGTTWEVPNNVSWSTPNHVTFNLDLIDRNASTEIILSGDNPLPVNLSLFIATYINDLPIINWETQTEADNIGWNVYRSVSNNIEQSFMLNPETIPGNGTTSQPSFYSFTDEYDVYEGFTYWYWIESISGSGETEIFGPATLTIPTEGNDIPEIPLVTDLYQNFPNPFNPSTVISFDIKEDETGILSIYNIKGQLIITEEFKTGRHQYPWDASDQASGVYLYQLKTNSYNKIIKMLLVK